MSFLDSQIKYDPFIGDPVQSNHLRASVKVVIGGTDVTDKLDPHLISIRILWPLGEKQAFLEIDDRDGRLPIPPIKTPITISIGWQEEGYVEVFDGWTSDIEYGASRPEGRVMRVHCVVLSVKDEPKTPFQNNWGEGAPDGQDVGEMIQFKTPAQEAAQHGNFKLDIHPRVAAINKDYWSQNGESALQFLTRISEEQGAFFGADTRDHGYITYACESPDGSMAPTTCTAIWGRNLIACRVRPWAARATWGGSNAQYYDYQLGQWKQLAKQFGFGLPQGSAKAIFSLPQPAPNRMEAEQQNIAAEQKASYETGDGRIIINGEPNARPNTFVHLQGVRPGVDGFYMITMAEHQYSRQSGFITWLDVNTYRSFPDSANAANAPDPSNDWSQFPINDATQNTGDNTG